MVLNPPGSSCQILEKQISELFPPAGQGRHMEILVSPSHGKAARPWEVQVSYSKVHAWLWHFHQESEFSDKVAGLSLAVSEHCFEVRAI